MNYNLIKIIEEIKKELSNKYLFDNFDIIVQDDDESITFWFTHEDIKGDKNFIEKFLKNAIDLLGKKGYKCIFGSTDDNEFTNF